ncbi:MAG: hypothetical protein M3Q31_15955, partial [Actinomycetota bacterium]|nr:hypothetical protein [Actinomycetota bacterium]
MRWHEVTGETLAPVIPSEPAGAIELQIVRTVPERVYTAAPRGDFRILESYLRVVQAAQQFIYIENQFLWPPEIAAALHAKLADPHNPDFRLLLVLPAKPTSGTDDTRGVLGELVEEDADAGQILACTLYARSGMLFDPVLRPRKNRDHRRRLAHPRLRQPERALALQRHRSEPRRPRLRPRQPHTPSALGRTPRALDRTGPSRPDQSDRRALETG